MFVHESRKKESVFLITDKPIQYPFETVSVIGHVIG